MTRILALIWGGILGLTLIIAWGVVFELPAPKDQAVSVEEIFFNNWEEMIKRAEDRNLFSFSSSFIDNKIRKDRSKLLLHSTVQQIASDFQVEIVDKRSYEKISHSLIIAGKYWIAEQEGEKDKVDTKKENELLIKLFLSDTPFSKVLKNDFSPNKGSLM
ncbi:MAG: hypothetical protein ACOCVY_00845 [Patescibacteria group bacterium]